ncbi:MAG: ABC transporter ATP-binding protein [Phycisphaerae bacterium]|nr:ABC transporter ATP-binding protein [Phycisphaerae bacterium]
MKTSKLRYRDFLKNWRSGRNGADSATPGGPDAAKPRQPKKRRKYFRDYLGWLWPYRAKIAYIFVVAFATALLSMVLPAVTMYMFDNVIQHTKTLGRQQSLHLLNVAGGSVLVVICVMQGLDWVRHWNVAKLNAQVLARLRQRLYEHMLRLPLHELSELKTGGITSRLSSDVDSVTGIVQVAIITPAIAALKVIITLGVLVWINWKMSVAAALLLPPIIVLDMLYIRRIRPIYRSMRRDREDIDARSVETFGGVRVVWAFAREFFEGKNFGKMHHTVVRKTLLARALEFVVWSGWGFLIPLCTLVVTWLGGVLVLYDQATIGGIIAFQMYVMMLLSPMSTLVESYGQTQQALAAMERIFDVIELPTDMPDRPDAQQAPTTVRSITFDDVSFAYPISTQIRREDDHLAPREKPAAESVGANGSEAAARHANPLVLKNFSLEAPGGATIALVGPSGSGKTTVTNLVARFYDPTRGAIRLNGVDLRDIQLKSFRGLLGLVQQDTFLFDGTVAENIAYSRPRASRAEIEDAARRANAHGFISTFSEGYDTLIGERGVRLSGGQAQRVSIARAILADPQILILDEATSNLDSESEQLIQAALRELLKNRTTFVIAHRLSTITHADLIVVIENGEIIESGSHATLMARDGRYREMVERQQAATLGEHYGVTA